MPVDKKHLGIDQAQQFFQHVGTRPRGCTSVFEAALNQFRLLEYIIQPQIARNPLDLMCVAMRALIIACIDMTGKNGPCIRKTFPELAEESGKSVV